MEKERLKTGQRWSSQFTCLSRYASGAHTAIRFGERTVIYVPVSVKAVVLHASCLFLDLPFWLFWLFWLKSRLFLAKSSLNFLKMDPAYTLGFIKLEF